MPGPLAGLTLIDVTTFLAGPLATQMLGDLGAEVIKIETPPFGDTMRAIGPARNRGMPSQYLTYNRNKKSVAIDLKRPQGLEALKRLVARADIFIHNMRPPAARRLGIAYSEMSAVNPNIVYASIPGFSQNGPLKDRAAYDDLIQGMSGICGMSLRRDGTPTYVPFNLADKLSAYCTVTAVGMALVHRERTGEGQEVQVPMLETMLEFNCADQLYGYVFEPIMEPGIGHPRALSPARRPFQTSDGYICMQTTTNEQFKRLFDVIGTPELMDDPRFSSVETRTKNLGELLPKIAERLKRRSTAEWQDKLTAADIPNAPMLTLDDLQTSSYIRDTGFFHVYDHPTEGKMRTPKPAAQYSKSTLDTLAPPPNYGEHTDAILSKLGYSGAEIDVIAGRATAR